MDGIFSSRMRFAFKLFVFCLVMTMLVGSAFAAATDSSVVAAFPIPVAQYNDASTTGLAAKLLGRIKADPFNAIATGIFLAAIVHTFLAAKFRTISHRCEHEHEVLVRKLEKSSHADASLLRDIERKKFQEVAFHFLGEVEAVFGIWLIPLAITIALMKGPNTFLHYINGVNYTEPVFVVVIMAIASSRPVLSFAEGALRMVAGLGKKTPAAWWLAILTVGPLLGSFITEPAAMTICALILVEKFYKLQPSMGLRYATLGLLFVNISIGGTLTHFAAPPVVMVAGHWKWDSLHMLTHFGWKAAVSILISNALAFFIFRQELLKLRESGDTLAHPKASVPTSIILTHLALIGLVVLTSHYAAIVVLIFMFFLAFVAATERNQDPINLRGPVLVGFFLAGLVIHGGCQQWWIDPVLASLNPVQMLLGSTLLTAFNDNAAITYLASLVPGFSDAAKYAVMAGAVAGGGLTVIANAPNPAGQSILQPYFGTNGVDAVKLFLAAAIPTTICVLIFLLTQ
jgi:hypothetical protein